MAPQARSASHFPRSRLGISINYSRPYQEARNFPIKRTIFTKVPSELHPGERSDVSWISTDVRRTPTFRWVGDVRTVGSVGSHCFPVVFAFSALPADRSLDSRPRT